jgi:hypothetical protein
MIKILMICLITCIFNSCKIGNEIPNLESTSQISIFYSLKDQFRKDRTFTIFDSNEIEIIDKGWMFYRYIIINHSEYVELLKEIKRIHSLKDSTTIEELYFEFNLVEKGNLVERLRLSGLSQIKDYIFISNKILGENNNYMPLLEYIK